MKKRVIAVIAVLSLSVAMFGCKAGSDTGNGKKQSLPQARTVGFGMPDWIRTSGLQSRSLTLYPTELRAHIELGRRG